MTPNVSGLRKVSQTSCIWREYIIPDFYVHLRSLVGHHGNRTDSLSAPIIWCTSGKCVLSDCFGKPSNLAAWVEAWHACSLQESRTTKWHNDSTLWMTSGNVIPLYTQLTLRRHLSALIKNKYGADRMWHECCHLNAGLLFQDSQTRLPTVSRAPTRCRGTLFF